MGVRREYAVEEVISPLFEAVAAIPAVATVVYREGIFQLLEDGSARVTTMTQGRNGELHASVELVQLLKTWPVAVLSLRQ